MTASRFLLAVACDAPGEVLERTWGEVAREDGAASVAAAAATAGLAAALAKFAGERPATAGTAVRTIVATGLLAEARAQASLALLRDMAAAAGREALAIKGGGLALAGIYAGEREFVDVDLLVRREELDAWTDAARRAGAEVVPCLEAHELAYVRRGGALVELHAGLPAAVGKDCGPGFDAVRPHAGEPVPGFTRVRPVVGRAAREIAVHHFVFHHGGEPGHTFRTLQDLAHVPDSGGPGLPWGAHAPGAALRGLEQIVASVRAGTFGGRVAEFLLLYGAVNARQRSPESEFADVIDRWLALRKRAGEGRTAFVMSRVFPAGLPLGARVARPFRLAARYVSGSARRTRRASASIGAWRRFLEGT